MKKDGSTLDDVMALGLQAAGDTAYVWNLQSDELTLAGDVTWIAGQDQRGRLLHMTGENWNERISPEDQAERLHALNSLLEQRGAYECEYRLRTSSGGHAWVHDKGRATFDDKGAPIQLTGVVRTIGQRKMREHVLERRANYAELTGHLNRSRLREALSHAIAYTERYKDTGAYIAIGIDKLSMINDGFGHEVADAVIVGVGQRIERCLRVTDTVGRIGGDRFGVVLANCDMEGLQVAADKILEAFRRAPVETPVNPIRITVSIGGALFPLVVRTAHDSMTAAESALQEAKSRGRNCFVAFELTENQRRQQRENMATGESVLRALDSGRIRFAYQPVIEARTGRIAYYETLLRLTQPDGSIQTAANFVPVAEKLGLMRLLDKRALELAIEDLFTHPDVMLALNVSSLTVTDQSWLRGLVGAVHGRPEIAHRLIVEITETAAMEDFDVSARFVSAVRDLGCKVALDDFGAGFTSFRHMKSLPVDVVKIDGSFVQNLHQNTENQLFIKTLRGLAQGFGFDTVAECVEVEEEAVLLREAGIDYLQGYYFGRPDIDPEWRRVRPVAGDPVPDSEVVASPVVDSKARTATSG